MAKEIIHTFLTEVENALKDNSFEYLVFLKRNPETFQKHQKILNNKPFVKDRDNEDRSFFLKRLKEHLHVLRDWLESEEADIRFLFTTPPWQGWRGQHDLLLRDFEEHLVLPYEEISFEAPSKDSRSRRMNLHLQAK